MLRIAALLAVLGGSLVAGSAVAQIGTIFGDAPPRPPSNIPNAGFPPQPPPVQYPGQNPQPYPDDATAYPPPPPSQTQPPGPRSSGIEAQPLPPPPGTALAPPVGSDQGMQRARIQPGFPPSQQPGGTSTLPQPGGEPPTQPLDSGPPPDDTVVTEMPAEKIANGRAVFSGLDKITGRIISFDAAIGETVQFGALQVTARVCYTRPPTVPANTDAFVEVDEVTLQGEIKRIFGGWMFAASPGLHAVEHPIYDVWLTDCAAPIKVAEPAPPPTPLTTPRAAAPPPRQRQNASQQKPPRQPPPVASQAQPSVPPPPQ
jgi:hypothetical protein